MLSNMSIEFNPYLIFYLFGCLLVIVLTLAKLILFTSIVWFTKANILKKNLKKIAPPDKRNIFLKIADPLVMFLVETILSWINVLYVTWQIITGILRVLRDAFNPVPEEIKMLRFPLRNNPYLERESVWAYMIALELKSGDKQPYGNYYKEMLDELSENYPTFNRIEAIKILEGLNVLTTETAAMFRDITNPMFKDSY
jgi:hypothetical protein